MKKVLIASKSCSTGKGRDYIAKRLASAGVEAVFGRLTDRLSVLGDFQGMVIGMDAFGEDILARAASLRFVLKFGVGVENIDLGAAERRGVKVRNMPGVNNDAVAEMAFALMLSAARRLAEGDRQVRSGQWPRLVGRGLIGKTMGIVGTGAIGCRLARLAAGFDMRLRGFDPFENRAFAALGGTYAALDEVLAEADVVSVHAPLTEKTRRMIGARELSLMKPDAILVNTSRGPLVDEEALRAALETGRIFAAGLDVFEVEPAVGRPVTALDNLTSTPHIAASTRDTLERMDETCVDIVIEELGGRAGTA
ncbi:MAG: phosphoglycerate dehydrogenase [Planctomycetota bacterium]|jgi:D-3-phosphoglycerate dehydrogenase|nr:phosphoglycerate dehydrogenase [Planctomycetota bacterium]